MDFQATMSILESDLEYMILHEDAVPKALPFILLADITNSFSDEQKIGTGGFAVVYKGMLQNGDVAVKRLSSSAYMYENEFRREIECLMKVKHKNIVRFLGYCVDTQGNVASDNGKFVIADRQEKLLCFEYLQKGSLRDYIDDPSCGLEWRDRYKIIKGICQGLCYLHQKNILHLDLKPDNILLDENMLPKIADFGLSRCFVEEQTRVVTTKVGGTIGYLAPEFTSNEITHKFDVYSLGVIITEILTGKKGYQDTENVLESWKNRMHISEDDPELEQIKVCTEIGMQCTKFNPRKRPDSMKQIMDRLVETEGAEVIPEAEPDAGPMQLLSVHPLELCFPFEYKKLTPCSLSLTNNTNELVAFSLICEHSSSCFLWLPVYGIVQPRSTYTLVVTTKSNVQIVERNDLILESTTLMLGDKKAINKFRSEPDKFLEVVKDTGTNVVQEVRLTAVYTPGPAEMMTSSSTAISPEIKMINAGGGGHENIITSLDTIHSKQWIITGYDHGHVRIWNHQTQKLLSSFKVSEEIVTCVQFIARKQWFVVGTGSGDIHVYNCELKLRKIKSFATGHRLSVESMAVHPTQPYLVSTYFNYMLLLDWDKDWKCAQRFENEHFNKILQVVFHPKDDTIATASQDRQVKVWSLDSPDSKQTFSGHLNNVNCLAFFTSYGQEYLVTGSDDQTAKIWDMQKNKCVRTLEAFMSPVLAVLYEHKRHILIIGSKDGCIYLWSNTNSRINSRSPSLERIVNIGSGGAVRSLAYLMGRVVIGKKEAVAIMNIDNNVNNQDESTDDYSEALSSAYNHTTGPTRDATCKVMSSSSKLLDVVLELIRLPCEPNESISWLVHLTNSTDEHVTFMLMDKGSRSIELLAKHPLYGIVPSRSSYTLIVSMTKEELARLQETDFDLNLQSSVSGDNYAVLFIDQRECRCFFEDAKEIGNDVHEVAVLLKADYCAPQLGESTKSKPELIPTRIKIISMKNSDDELCSLDAHPTEEWIITGHVNGYACTWNHETQGPMDTFKVSEKSVVCVKVIARKQWIIAMANDSSIYVYSCACVTKMQKMTSFRDDIFFATDDKSITVHPVLPYVLSTSGNIWDWEKGWERNKQVFSGRRAHTVALINPKDNSFSCAFGEVVGVWNSFDSRESDCTLSGHVQKVNCLDFFTRDDGQYLITGSNDCTAKIWDWQNKECIHTMEAIFSPVTCVISLPDRPYLVTGSEHGTVQLWSSTDFRILRTVNFGRNEPLHGDPLPVLGHINPLRVLGLAYTMGSRRVVVGQSHAISILEINDEEVVASEGSHDKSTVQGSP